MYASAQHDRDETLRESLSMRREKRFKLKDRAPKETIWALRDIDLTFIQARYLV